MARKTQQHIHTGSREGKGTGPVCTTSRPTTGDALPPARLHLLFCIIFLVLFIFCLLCMNALPACVHVHQVCAWCSQMSEVRGRWIPWSLIDGYHRDAGNQTLVWGTISALNHSAISSAPGPHFLNNPWSSKVAPKSWEPCDKHMCLLGAIPYPNHSTHISAYSVATVECLGIQPLVCLEEPTMGKI